MGRLYPQNHLLDPRNTLKITYKTPSARLTRALDHPQITHKSPTKPSKPPTKCLQNGSRTTLESVNSGPRLRTKPSKNHRKNPQNRQKIIENTHKSDHKLSARAKTPIIIARPMIIFSIFHFPNFKNQKSKSNF